jgi:transposase
VVTPSREGIRCPAHTLRSSDDEPSSWPTSETRTATASSRFAKTAENLGISDSCLRNWINQAEIDTGERPSLSSDERRELGELRRRTRVLEMENEILKRASAYFARENVLPK